MNMEELQPEGNNDTGTVISSSEIHSDSRSQTIYYHPNYIASSYPGTNVLAVSLIEQSNWNYI